MDPERFDVLVDAFLHEQMSTGEMAELQAALSGNPDYQRAFVVAVDQHQALYDAYRPAEAAAPGKIPASPKIIHAARRRWLAMAAAAAIGLLLSVAIVAYQATTAQSAVAWVDDARDATIIHGKEERAAGQASKLYASDELKVGPRGSATIALPEGAQLRLGALTALRITARDSKHAAGIELKAGEINVSAATQAGNAPLAISTPFLRAEAATAGYALRASAAVTKLEVTTGIVEATRLSDHRRIKIHAGEFVLGARDVEFRAQPGSSIAAAAPLPADGWRWDFSTGSAGWHSGAAGMRVEAQNAVGLPDEQGRGALHLAGVIEKSWCCAESESVSLALRPDAYYRFSAWLGVDKVEPQSRAVLLWIEFLDASGTIVGRRFTEPYDLHGEKWQRLALEFPAPAGVTQVHAQLIRDYALPTQLDLYLGGVMLEPIATPHQQPPYTWDFATGLDGWQAAQTGAEIVRVEHTPDVGASAQNKGALHVHGRSALQWDYVYGGDRLITPRARYHVSAWLRVDSIGAGTPAPVLHCEYYGYDPASKGRAFSAPYDLKRLGTWQHLSLEFTAAPGSSVASVAVGKATDADTTIDFYLNDVRLEPAGGDSAQF